MKKDRCFQTKDCTGKIELLEYQKHMEKVKENLNAANAKLEKHLNESDYLLHILEKITTIKNFDSLIEELNDMLIGALGLTYSSIFTIKNRKFKLQVTNKKTDSFKMEESVKTAKKYLCGIKEITDITHLFEKSYLFNGAVLYVPLIMRDQTYKGFILLEHKDFFYFDQDKMRLIKQLYCIITLLMENSFIYERLENAVYLDSLTGIYNRAFFDHILPKTILNKEEFLLAFFDVDYFKNINDFHGHMAGDDVLKQLCMLVSAIIRPSDIFCRIGGEEFAVIFRDIYCIDTAYNRLNQIRKTIEQTVFFSEEQQMNITCSFGAVPSVLFKDSPDVKDILKYADQALYQSKRKGRNQITVIEEI